eukprot:7867388-Lingulodinium_polyedra.AAC.1
MSGFSAFGRQHPCDTTRTSKSPCPGCHLSTFFGPTGLDVSLVLPSSINRLCVWRSSGGVCM